MSGLKIYTSNRLEILAGNLAEVLKNPLSSPMEKEVIVVQSKGMERWLSMQLAARHGICCNYHFPFPNHFVSEIIEKIIPQFLLDRSFEPGFLTWRIMKLLPRCVESQKFTALKNYLGRAEDKLKMLQVADKIADVFDQYLIFRPEMIFSWEKGEENHWQALLWRELVRERGARHRAALGKALLDSLAAEKETGQLPGRVSVFGISALPRFYMELLSGMSRFLSVHLFLMNPCREYWGDILTEKGVKSRVGRVVQREKALEELHLEKGNSLLASMGALGRDFFDLINDFESEEFMFFDDPGEESLLCCLQSDIMNMKNRSAGSVEKPFIYEDDDSIQIHACHSPMREVEVLQDRLLDMFQKDPELSPRDILVMAPDIEEYAPYVQAVFDLPPDDERRIPFSIADRGLIGEGEISGPFLKILDLKGGRFQVPRVVAVLEAPAVRRAFGLDERDLDLILNWIKETRIRWGVDNKSRSHWGVPGFHEHTWASGIERLVLGYALPGINDSMFRDILPMDHMEGEETCVLGRFLEFTGQLFSIVSALETPRRLGEWSEILMGILGGFFVSDEDSSTEMLMLRKVIAGLRDIEEDVNVDELQDFRLIRWHLERSIGRRGFGHGFITGGVTFCSMLPMRSIPFKVICLLGMNSDAYPRQSSPLGFDLIARHPRPGDRSQRKDDRYLFLESILSAREKLTISYVGQDIQDNSSLPPSVLVGELLDYIKGAFSNKAVPEETLEIRHRLQSFSPEYFKGRRGLFSYSEKNFTSALSLVNKRNAAQPFISEGLSEAGEEWNNVELEDLCLFFRNPSRFIVEKRLHIYLGKRHKTLEETEPFFVKGLDRYRINEKFLSGRLSGFETVDLPAWARASGLLPHGSVGECIVEGMMEEAEDFAEKMEFLMKGEERPPLNVKVDVSDFRISGLITGLYGERLVHYRPSRLRASDRLRTWLYHLILHSMALPFSSITAGLKGSGGKDWEAWEFPPVEKAREILETMLRVYKAGLVRPLPFFPETSLAYIESRMMKDSSHEEALGRALKKWEGSDYGRGEEDDEYFRLCFKDAPPLGEEFAELCERVLGPMLGSQKRLEGY